MTQMKPGTEHKPYQTKPLWSPPKPRAVSLEPFGPPLERQELYERFRKVILGAGYSEIAAQGILDEWFEKLIVDVPRFIQMLSEYETGRSG